MANPSDNHSESPAQECKLPRAHRIAEQTAGAKYADKYYAKT